MHQALALVRLKNVGTLLWPNILLLPIGGVKNATLGPTRSGRPCADAADATTTIAAAAAIRIDLRMIPSR